MLDGYNELRKEDAMRSNASSGTAASLAKLLQVSDKNKIISTSQHLLI